MPYAASVFDSHAAHYQAARTRLIPPFERFYGTAVGAVAMAGGEVRRVLDLGAGTGMLAGFVRDAYRGAHVTLFDGAPQMLAEARGLLGEERVEFVQGDMYGELPEGPWDAVVSALAIHHMTDEGKKHVYGHVLENLRPGGVFINAEHVLGSTEWLDEIYRDYLESGARANGITGEEWAQAEERMKADHLTPLEPQLKWLRELGYQDVDCLFKDHAFAVMFGRRGR